MCVEDDVRQWYVAVQIAGVHWHCSLARSVSPGWYTCHFCSGGRQSPTTCVTKCVTTAARSTTGEPPKIDLQGVDGVDKLVRAPRQSPLQPHPTAQRRSRGRAALSEGLIATSHAFSAPLQGQHGQRCGGAPSSGTTSRKRSTSCVPTYVP